jgi:hypothetical protein
MAGTDEFVEDESHDVSSSMPTGMPTQMPKRISNSTDGRVTAESATSSPLKNRKMSATKLEALPVISPKQDSKSLGQSKPKTGKPPMQKAATDHFNYKYVKILLKS